MEKRARGLAMFNLAIDSKLRGCDMVRLKMWRQMVSRSIVLPSGREKPDIPSASEKRSMITSGPPQEGLANFSSPVDATRNAA